MAKKSLCFIILCVFTLIAASCSSVPGPSQAHKPASPAAATDGISEEPPAGGEHMGDDLYSPYGMLFDHIQFLPGTFAMDASPYVDQFIEEHELNEGHDRPSVMYYLTQTMGLTREDLEAYYKELGAIDQMTERMYQGLLTDDLKESMQLLKTQYAFYSDGKLYTIYDLYEMKDTELADTFIQDAAHAKTWNAIQEYLSEPNTEFEFPSVLTAFVEQCAAEALTLQSK